MRRTNHHRQPSFGKSGRGALEVTCESCGTPLPAAIGFHLCPTCWQADKVCRVEGVAKLGELVDPAKSRACLLWRVSDVIRRSDVADAEALVRALERSL